MGLTLSILLGVVPMLIFAAWVYWLDRYEKEPLVLLGGAFTWGAIVAAGGAFIINTAFGVGVYLFTRSQSAANLTTSSLIAPIVEESLKGLAVMVVFILFRSEFDSILDGIVYASVVALGFAATENAYYIFTYGYQEKGLSGLLALVFIRVILVGWQHPFYTAFTGIGLAMARLNRSVWIKVLAPVLGWSLAVFTHAAHNTLADLLSGIGLGGIILGSMIDWSGWILMFFFIIWAIRRDQKFIIQNLKEEVTQGIITPRQYQVACSAWAQSGARFNALIQGQYRSTSRFYQLCGELAHKKEQLSTLGEEGGNFSKIQNIRQELLHLSPTALA
jgi:RsiW-degrading membrane proteinase PrsW (M82 family)